MKVVFDLGELALRCRALQDRTSELAGLANDVRVRVDGDLLERVAPYGLTPPTLDMEGRRIAEVLMRDADELAQVTLDTEGLFAHARLVQADAAQPPALTTQPDLWWFQGTPDLQAVEAPDLPPAGVPGGGTTGTSDVATGDLRGRVMATATAWIGTPYGWGGGHGAIMSPHAAPVDCSGLVRQALTPNGFEIGGTSRTMFGMGTTIDDPAAALPGDLAFWGQGRIHHVAICAGDMRMVEAPHTGSFVRETALRLGDLAGIRRVLP